MSKLRKMLNIYAYEHYPSLLPFVGKGHAIVTNVHRHTPGHDDGDRNREEDGDGNVGVWIGATMGTTATNYEDGWDDNGGDDNGDEDDDGDDNGNDDDCYVGDIETDYHTTML